LAKTASAVQRSMKPFTVRSSRLAIAAIGTSAEVADLANRHPDRGRETN
jgi:hypothetical protein